MCKTWSKRRRAKFDLLKELERKKQNALVEQHAAFAELAAEREVRAFQSLVRVTNQDIVPFDDSPLGAIVDSDE